MTGSNLIKGHDFSEGISLDRIPEEGTLSGRVADEPVLLSRLDGQLVAVSGSCTHYGALLAAGVDGDTVRCPLHHACFSLRSGSALRGPALDPLHRWEVRVDQDTVFVDRKLKVVRDRNMVRQSDVRRILIVGGGAAGIACASELRRLRFGGEVTVVTAEPDLPTDRPNLSKDYLSGGAPEEWLPIRSDDWYLAQEIDLRRGVTISQIDPDRRVGRTCGGQDIEFDRLLIATGSEPRRLMARGFDHKNVFSLRSLADARAISAQAKQGARAVVIGASFIGLEAAAALRTRQVEVTVISPERVPFAGAFGEQIGLFLQQLHERNGVRFHLGATASSFDGNAVMLADAKKIDADFVLVGIGVQPRTALAKALGLVASEGVLVDAHLQTDIDGIYAAGDIAAYPDPISGECVRIEHWVTAQRQGQVAASNMLGQLRHYDAVPFFWTEQYGIALRYVGQARGWNEIEISGDPQSGKFISRYYSDGTHLASAAIDEDAEILNDERKFEKQIAEVRRTRAEQREP